MEATPLSVGAALLIITVLSHDQSSQPDASASAYSTRSVAVKAGDVSAGSGSGRARAGVTTFAVLVNNKVKTIMSLKKRKDLI
jgi:hypothetical protein